MAKKLPVEPEDLDERDRPVRTMVALVVGFLVIVGIAIGAVLLPELRDDAGEEEDGAPAAAPSAEASPSVPAGSAPSP
jgi:hypothetical protein